MNTYERALSTHEHGCRSDPGEEGGFGGGFTGFIQGGLTLQAAPYELHRSLRLAPPHRLFAALLVLRHTAQVTADEKDGRVGDE